MAEPAKKEDVHVETNADAPKTVAKKSHQKDPEHGAHVQKEVEPVVKAPETVTPTPYGAAVAAYTAPQTDIKITSVKKFRGSIRPFNQEFNQKNYTLPVDDDVTIDDVSNPAFWANVASEMTAGDMLYLTLGGTDPRFLWLYVYETGHLWAKIKILMNTSLADAAQSVLGLRLAEATQDFQIINKGGQNKWCVQRLKDKAILWSGGASQRDATFWLDEYKKSLRR